MATQNATKQDLAGDDSAISWAWTLTGTDTGAPVKFIQWADRSVQVGSSGDNFNGGTVLIEGSNDNGTWTTLRDPAGVALSFTAAGLKQILESVAWIRPRASVSVTSVVVTLAVRRAQQLRT